MLEYSKHHEKYIFAGEWSFSSATLVQIGQYECRCAHPDIGKFYWCEINHRFDCIVAAFMMKEVKNGRVSSKCLLPVGNMIENFADMLIGYAGQHSHGGSRNLDGRPHGGLSDSFTNWWEKEKQNGMLFLGDKQFHEMLLAL